MEPAPLEARFKRQPARMDYISDESTESQGVCVFVEVGGGRVGKGNKKSKGLWKASAVETTNDDDAEKWMQKVSRTTTHH